MTEFLGVPGGRIAYDVDGSGPLVVLSHGIGDRRQAYRFLAPMLAQAGYRVAGADLRGHGESSMGWASITRTDVAGDLAALTGHLGGPAEHQPGTKLAETRMSLRRGRCRPASETRMTRQAVTGLVPDVRRWRARDQRSLGAAHLVPWECPAERRPVHLGLATRPGTVKETGTMIEISGLVKRYGDKTAVDELDFTVKPGVVTGFLGPNGAGKSTTMRLIVGLDAPTSGSATVNGRAYASYRAPLREVGALLEAGSVHPGRSAFSHLRALAATHGIGRRRVQEVIELTGLSSVARQRAGKFSLGMGQRLGIAAALLGDPETLMLDEPVNGLDPEGVLWVRTLLKGLAAEGRTVFVSSHLISEMAQTATNLIVIGRGKLLADTTVSQLTAQDGGQSVTVTSSDPARLRQLLAGPAVTGAPGSDSLQVTGLSARQIGTAAAQAGIAVYELTPQIASLEQAFMDLTGEHVEFRSVHPAGAAGPAERSAA